MSKKKIRARERTTIIKALRAGVVPNVGLHHIQVGRSSEISALLEDIDHIKEEGSSIRFIIGEYGSGKTFFMNLIRLVAMEKKMVVAHADLTPDRRLQSTGGHAQALFSELMTNISTRTKPDGGALSNIIERFISQMREESEKTGQSVEQLVFNRLAPLKELVSGFDFARVITEYWRAYEEEDHQIQGACLKWLRGEYATKTNAKKELPIGSIIDDNNYYDYLKLFARFVRLAGYEGFVVSLDEMVNLYKLNHKISRSRNYEQVLRILNDSLQGRASGIGFLFGGTPEFLSDSYRGLYSYEALETRLAENSFAQEGLVDLSGPVIRLENLSPEDLFVLLSNIRHVFAKGEPASYLIPDEAIAAFMQHCSQHVGDAYFRTPRSSVRAFTDFLSILEQNPEATWQDLLPKVQIQQETNPDLLPLEEEQPSPESDGRPQNAPVSPAESDDELTSFRL